MLCCNSWKVWVKLCGFRKNLMVVFLVVVKVVWKVKFVCVSGGCCVNYILLFVLKSLVCVCIWVFLCVVFYKNVIFVV